MWRIILTVSLLCWRSEGSVTCKDNNNGEVDWYILYKAPSLQSLTGVEYLYIDSTGVTVMVPNVPNFKSIDNPNGILANTLRPLFTPIRSMPPNFGFISYSDQPPGCSANTEFGHSKGVLMVDNTGPGVWLLHSTPQFPFRRDQNSFWPNTGTQYAQTFICVTFPYDQFSLIGEHLQYIGAFPFEHDVPQGFHQELKDAANWVKKDPPTTFPSLISRGNKIFYGVAKQQSDEPKVGDLYVSIAKSAGSDVYVQTWGRQTYRKPSYCVRNMPKVINVKKIHTDMGNWEPKNDHSKWCVAKDQNKHWTCIADVNRATTQYERRGGALCFEDEDIQEIFLKFVSGIEDCPTGNMDFFNPDLKNWFASFVSFLEWVKSSVT